MDSLERYGDLRGPERKGRIKAEAEPLKIVVSLYQVYRPVADRIILEKKDWYHYRSMVESLYGEACELFRHYSDMDAGWGAAGVLAEKAWPKDGTGMLLSALLNSTGTEGLVVERFPELDMIGYRIKGGRTLVLREGTQALSAGREGRGVVLNWGECRMMGLWQEGGFQANFGSTDFLAHSAKAGVAVNWGFAKNMAYSVKGGMQANFLEVDEMGYGADDGLQVNFGHATNMASNAMKGLQLNYGRIGASLSRYAKEGSIQINFGKVREMSSGLTFEGTPKASNLMLNAGLVLWARHQEVTDAGEDAELLSLGRELKGKFRDIGFLRKCRKYSPEAVESIRGFDFAAFESEIAEIAQELETYARGRYGKQA